MIHPEFFDAKQEFVGTTGLVLFGHDRALSFVRDYNTNSYPGFVDLAGGGRELGENPFETFARELEEEFGLRLGTDQVEYALRGPSLIQPKKLGWFTVARLEEAAETEIRFGNEGLGYQVTRLDELVTNSRLIPQRRDRINSFMAGAVLL